MMVLIHMFVLPFWSFKHYIEETNLEETVIFSESPEPWGWVGGVRYLGRGPQKENSIKINNDKD